MMGKPNAKIRNKIFICFYYPLFLVILMQKEFLFISFRMASYYFIYYFFYYLTKVSQVMAHLHNLT